MFYVPQLFVSNLPFSTTIQEVWQWFGQFGPIFCLDLLKDDKGLPRGKATVRFWTFADANIAMTMTNSQVFKGRKISYRRGWYEPHYTTRWASDFFALSVAPYVFASHDSGCGCLYRCLETLCETELFLPLTEPSLHLNRPSCIVAGRYCNYSKVDEP